MFLLQYWLTGGSAKWLSTIQYCSSAGNGDSYGVEQGILGGSTVIGVWTGGAFNKGNSGSRSISSSRSQSRPITKESTTENNYWIVNHKLVQCLVYVTDWKCKLNKLKIMCVCYFEEKEWTNTLN